MADVTAIADIVDATAAVAMEYVAGVKAAYGWGAGNVKFLTGPRAGQLVETFLGKAIEPGTHVSDVPSAPTITYFSADATELRWLIPFRFYLDKNSPEEARRLAVPFYGRYLTAFSQEVKLRNLVPGGSCLIQSYALFETDAAVGLGGFFEVHERLDLAMSATH